MPTPGRGESAGQFQPKPTLNDAQMFLNSVKDSFKDNKEKYDDFLKVLYEFKAKRLSFISAIVRVKLLFLGHKEVLLGFNNFLPKTFKIILPDYEQKQLVPLEALRSFVNKIKCNSAVWKALRSVNPAKEKNPWTDEIHQFLVDVPKRRFRDEEHKYKSFLGILKMYKTREKSKFEVYHEIKKLLRGHDDLIVELARTLPELSAAAQNKHYHSQRHRPG